MKKIATADIFAAMRVVKATGMKDELKPILKKVASGESSVEDIGIEAILAVMEAASGTASERAIYQFLSGPFEMDTEAVAMLDLEDLMSNLEALARENDLRGFFRRLSGLMSLSSST